MNNTITEMKNTLERINSRINEAEEHQCKWKTEWWKSLLQKRKKKRIVRNEDSVRDLWDNIKYTLIHIIQVPEGEEREKRPEKIFEEIIAKKSPNVRKR